MYESPRGDVRGRRVSDPSGPSTTKTCQRFSTTSTERRRSMVAVITTVSAAPAESNLPNSIRLRLKPIARGAEVFAGRIGARVSLRLPPTAG